MSLIKIYIHSHFVRNSNSEHVSDSGTDCKGLKKGEQRTSIDYHGTCIVRETREVTVCRTASGGDWKADIHCYAPRTLNRDLELGTLPYFQKKKLNSTRMMEVAKISRTFRNAEEVNANAWNEAVFSFHFEAT